MCCKYYMSNVWVCTEAWVLMSLAPVPSSANFMAALVAAA